jgi:hypothetical protein
MKRLTAAQIQREIDETARSLPIVKKLPALFTDPRMFRSVDHFSAEGFSLSPHHPEKMMCGRHKHVKGYVFKKFNDSFEKDQLINYLRRIEGAQLLRNFIADHGFSRVTAPKKWLYELPSKFPERDLVVAERLDLHPKEKTESQYIRIDEEQLHELATILYFFRGLNSTPSNLPYTEDDKIAFIDTERWDHDKPFLGKVEDRIPRERRRQAKAVYKELKRRGARPFGSAF